MAEHEDILERVIDTLREPVTIDASLDQRVMAAIATQPVASARRAWLLRPWTIRLTPIGALAAAASLAAIMFAGSLLLRPNVIVPVVARAPGGSGEVTQFVLVAPGAHSVALVGDFNDWNDSATKLVRQGGDGVWFVTVPLRPGRYRYAFVVDGTVWRSDPNAVGTEDDFGRPNSVVTIGGT